MSPDQHVKVEEIRPPGALRPAKVTPFCAVCRVAWPCPPAAVQIAAGDRPDD